MTKTEIVMTTKTIKVQGLDAYLPVLIVKTIEPVNNKTIKSVHISTGDPLVFREDAHSDIGVHCPVAQIVGTPENERYLNMTRVLNKATGKT